jgi:septum formation protein
VLVKILEHIMSNPPPLVLASTSPFRRELLGRLGLPFDTRAPVADETPLEQEMPMDLSRRLAELKARSVAEQFPDGLIIGSDQVACIEDRILGKPGQRDKAIDQLKFASGKTVIFYTGLCVLNAQSGLSLSLCESFRVHFRQLSDEQIRRYIDRENPLNCAGAFKAEGLGSALFERIEGDDPTALIGLPLIRLVDLLDAQGLKVL